MKRRGNWTGNHTRQITKEEMLEYGQFMRNMRESVGLTRAEMGEEMGVYTSTIRRWEVNGVIPQRDINEIVQDVRDIVKKYQSKAS